MKQIVVLTLGFPFGKDEPFLCDELPYHDGSIFISTHMGAPEKKRDINTDKIKIIRLGGAFFQGNRLVRFLSMLHAVFSPVFWKELFSSGIKPVTMRKILQLLSCISKAKEIEKEVRKTGELQEKESYVFYAYWMNHLALAAVMLAKRYHGIAVSRCHGYDLYKRIENNKYVTLQEYLANSLDYVFPISEDGCRVIRSLLPEQMCDKVMLSRLGTPDYLCKHYDKKEDFLIVSCSNVVALKRVSRIADAVASCNNPKIKWVHIGDGPLMLELKSRVKELGIEGQTTFLGYQSKAFIMEYYKRHSVSLFINVSESEGIPVSIMEALSFGIPCIGTNVGGIKEIIHHEYNGWLLSENPTTDEIAAAIVGVLSMEKNQYFQIRNNARNFWEENYSAEKNYSDVLRSMKAL